MSLGDTIAARWPRSSRTSRLGAGRRALVIAAAAIALFVVAPIAAVVLSVVEPASPVWAHLAETVLADYVLNSLMLAAGVGVGVFVIGTGCAWLVTMCTFRGRRLLSYALVVPLAVPAYVIAYAYTDLLQVAGPVQNWIRATFDLHYGEYWFPQIRTLGGAIAIFTLVLYPYVYLLARASFLEQSACAIEVGRTLGHSPFSVFWRVALPLARPAIAAGVALALMETLADFGAVSFFGVPTFTTGIYRAWFAMGDPVAAQQLASALLTFIVALVLIERLSRGRARFHHTTNRYRPLPQHHLRGAKAFGAALACALPAVLGFAIPALALVRLTGYSEAPLFGARFLNAIGTSSFLALTTAALAVALSLIVAYAVRAAPGPRTKLFARLSAMGYAVPGTVIAVGALRPLTGLDRSIDTWSFDIFGSGTGLLFTGGIVALVGAYLVRFLAVSLQTVEAGLTKLTPSIDGAAQTLSRSPLDALMRVHAPILTPSLLAAGLLVFVDVMKELPATLILRPFNFDTLAVQAFTYAADERLADAALPALTIVLVGLLPLAWVMRQSETLRE